jgi:hypothetical protein
MIFRLVAASLLLSSLVFADRVSGPAAGAAAPDIIAPMPSRPPRPRPAPQPSAEVAKQGKLMAGTYTCKGNRMLDGGASQPLQSTIVVKLDLDNAWLTASWTEKGAKLVDYRTFDDVSKQWTRFQLASDGSHAVLTSLGEKAGETVWEGASASSIGSVQQRHHEQLNGKELKLWGEALLGGTWQKTYEAACKR